MISKYVGLAKPIGLKSLNPSYELINFSELYLSAQVEKIIHYHWPQMAKIALILPVKAFYYKHSCDHIIPEFYNLSPFFLDKQGLSLTLINDNLVLENAVAILSG